MKHLGGQLSKYDMRAPYTKKISYALAKVMDQDLLALFSGLSQAVGTTADGLSSANITDAIIRAAMKKLDNADVDEDERFIILHATEKSELYGIDKFVRADAVGDAKERITRRFTGDIYGMGVYYTSLVPVKLAATAPATPTDSYANLVMHREALAIAIPQEVDIDYAYLPQKKAWILSGDVLYGVAEFRDAAGVVAFSGTA